MQLERPNTKCVLVEIRNTTKGATGKGTLKVFTVHQTTSDEVYKVVSSTFKKEMRSDKKWSRNRSLQSICVVVMDCEYIMSVAKRANHKSFTLRDVELEQVYNLAYSAIQEECNKNTPQ